MKISRLALNSLDRLTDISPIIVPKLFHKLILFILGNRLIFEIIQKIYRSKLRKVGNLNKILIIVDINIGDSIIVQSSVKVLRYYFPESQIDYTCNRIGGVLVDELTEATNIIKLYIKNGLPTEQEEDEIKEIIIGNSYDLILNFCPFLKLQNFNNNRIIHFFIPLSSYIIHLWKKGMGKRHISYSIHSFTLKYFATCNPLRNYNIRQFKMSESYFPYDGNRIYLSDEDMNEAKHFLVQQNILNKGGIIMFHPDTPSIYTLIPHYMQIELIRKLLESEEVGAVLIGIGRSFKDIEKRVISELPNELKKKIIIVPDIPISTYAALIDCSDVFVSGDTGPLHIAAAKRFPKNPDSVQKVRNKTAIITIFGATDAKMYGYDSEKENYLPANQNAPSRVYISKATCRNITCVDKLMKSCRNIRCFEGIDIDSITGYIITYLSVIREESSI